MIQDYLQRSLQYDPSFTLRPRIGADDDEILCRENETFELIAESGETVGIVKAWLDEDASFGFVHFDPDGGIVDWQVRPADQPHRRSR